LALKDWWHSFSINTVTTIIIVVVFGVLPPAAVLRAYGLSFIKTTHPVPGWLILCSAAVGGLFVFSAGLNIWQRLSQRRAARRTLAVVAEGYPTSVHWSLGKRGDTPVMCVAGDFHITNLRSQNISVPRTVLIVAHRRWRVIPRRLRIEGAGVYEGIEAGALVRDRLLWWIEPPVLKTGETLHAKVGFIDNLGQINWGEWLDWKYLG
jgi:hypothetical protein